MFVATAVAGLPECRLHSGRYDSPTKLTRGEHRPSLEADGFPFLLGWEPAEPWDELPAGTRASQARDRRPRGPRSRHLSRGGSRPRPRRARLDPPSVERVPAELRRPHRLLRPARPPSPGLRRRDPRAVPDHRAIGGCRAGAADMRRGQRHLGSRDRTSRRRARGRSPDPNGPPSAATGSTDAGECFAFAGEFGLAAELGVVESGRER